MSSYFLPAMHTNVDLFFLYRFLFGLQALFERQSGQSQDVLIWKFYVL